MKFACYIKKEGLSRESGVENLLSGFRGCGHEVYPVSSPSEIQDGTDALLSLGGDGTFLAASRVAVPSGLPMLGVNFGRLGFLSENGPGDLPEALSLHQWTIEERGMLKVESDGFIPEWPYALNEVAVFRKDAAMLGIDVELDGRVLPTYWADGLLVATSSGSTAYSLSVGGPICMPDSRVLIVSPICPHNLNVRPLIVPEETEIRISLQARTGDALFSLDNTTCTIPAGSKISVHSADVRLKRIRMEKSDFINALRSRLLWGQDVRNSEEKI